MDSWQQKYFQFTDGDVIRGDGNSRWWDSQSWDDAVVSILKSGEQSTDLATQQQLQTSGKNDPISRRKPIQLKDSSFTNKPNQDQNDQQLLTESLCSIKILRTTFKNGQVHVTDAVFMDITAAYNAVWLKKSTGALHNSEINLVSWVHQPHYDHVGQPILKYSCDKWWCYEQAVQVEKWGSSSAL